MEICFTRLILPSGTLRISGLLLLHNSGGICMTSCKAYVRDRNKFLFILHKFNTNYPSVPIQMSKARGKRIIKIYYRPCGITGCLVNFFWRQVKWVVNLAAVGTGTTKQVNNWSQHFAIYLKIYDRKIFSHVSCTSEQPLFFHKFIC